jgi:protein transport protein SEC24
LLLATLLLLLLLHHYYYYRGLRITNFYGNYFIRGTDLLALPNCTTDSVFAVEFGYDEQVLTASVISIQAALLYTNSSGERRIRVHNLAIPVKTVIQVACH